MDKQRSQRNAVAAAEGGWLQWGTHWVTTYCWGIIGVVCATASPLFMPKEKGYNEYDLYVVMAIIFDCTVILYHVAFLLRHRPMMRARRRWVGNMVGNFIVSGITTVVVIFHDKTQNGIIWQTLIAVAVFVFMEIAKPVFDFGILQFFLRLPFQTAILCYRHYFVGWHVLTAFVLVFGTVWQSYYMHIFTERQVIRRNTVTQDTEPPISAPSNTRNRVTHDTELRNRVAHDTVPVPSSSLQQSEPEILNYDPQ